MKKFVNIEIEGEDNVAVIDLGKIKSPTESEACDKIHSVLPPKLTQALQEHFDADVEIKSINVISTLPPLEIKAIILIQDEDNDGEAIVQEITLNETWVY